MNNVIFFCGAGINQVIKDEEGFSPPLINNFFQILLKKSKYKGPYYSCRIQNILDYIYDTYPHVTKDDLINGPFDLEFFFTYLQRQARIAEKQENIVDMERLEQIRIDFVSLLGELLSDYLYFVDESNTMQRLGEVILFEKPTIISFNYDCIIEYVIQAASGFTKTPIPPSIGESEKITKEEICYCRYNWNVALGYGFKFDKVQLQQPGITKYAEGDEFYSVLKKELYPKPILKLHGSLNWFRYSNGKEASSPIQKKRGENEKNSEVILRNATWWHSQQSTKGSLPINPIIITPVLYKDEYYELEPFPSIWSIAKKTLSECTKLVVIGYSFPPTDFSSKSLLFDALYSGNIEELIVVNPDINTVNTVKQICRFNKGVIWYSNLEDFINSYSNIFEMEKVPMEKIKKDIPKEIKTQELYAKCKTCGIKFNVGIVTDQRSFTTSQFKNNIHVCPRGHANSYDKEDYSFN